MGMYGISADDPMISLWAKKSHSGEAAWLPLIVHLADTAEAAGRFWELRVSDGEKAMLAEKCRTDEDSVKRLLIFLAAVHDLGKATPVFQDKKSDNGDVDARISENRKRSGFIIKDMDDKPIHHALASQVLLERLVECKTNVAVIAGAHHGKPPETGYDNYCGCPNHYGRNEWERAQREIISAALGYAGFSSVGELPIPTMPAQVVLSGMLIAADWIASNEKYFPLIPIDAPINLDPAARAERAFSELALTAPWTAGSEFRESDFFRTRFDFPPNALQWFVSDILSNSFIPGIMVIEAPMGKGKTELALLVAEIFAHRAQRGGLLFSLPTQATSDGVFDRIKSWTDKINSGERHSINLVHGKAQFNEDFQALPRFGSGANIGNDEDDLNVGVTGVHTWFSGRKLAMLADFAVGTIDQLLLMALKAKHLMLRHLGLSGKVVIIDECHAYDAYMSQFLTTALRWLGAYGVPVIVLSATLPAEKRVSVIKAYLGLSEDKGSLNNESALLENRAYPLITYTDGDEVYQRAVPDEDAETTTVQLERLAFEAVGDKLEEVLRDGGCAGVIVNTVRRSQQLAREFRKRFGGDVVRLLHSRFLTPDRMEKERALREELGKPAENSKRPAMCIVVGTQVLEQSLDIDFDVLITDICPMDLLLQRIGRLHRHSGRIRPPRLREPVCYVTGLEADGFESGSLAIYGEYLLARTRKLLPDSVTLPNDIPILVNKAYRDDTEDSEAKRAWRDKMHGAKSKAKTFLLCEPMKRSNKTIVGWLNTDIGDDPSGKRGERTVRDTSPSIEVLAVIENGGVMSLFSGQTLPRELDDDSARELAKQSIRLPAALSGDKRITELEELARKKVPQWQESKWLKGELFLFFDETGTAQLGDYTVKYSTEDGLSYEKFE